MNILFVTSAMGRGGGEVWLKQISTSLAGRGHSVTIAHNHGAALTSLFTDRSEDGVELIPVRLGGDFDPFVVGTLVRLIRNRTISLVCTNMEKDLRLGGLAAVLSGVSIVPSREIDEAISDTWLNRIFWSAIPAGVLVNSHATMNTLLHGAPWLDPARIHIVWKGVDVAHLNMAEAMPLREMFHIPAAGRIAGFAGKLDQQKGIPTLLEAAWTALAKEPSLHIVLAGEGNLRGKIQEFKGRHGLENRIHLAGFCGDMPSFMKAIDFLVMPSYWEGFGYAAVEAMAAGKPVIGTWSSSLPELIADERTGLLVPPHAPQELAGAMQRLAEDNAICEMMGIAGRERARRMFSTQQMVNATERVFLEILDEQSRRNPRPGPIEVAGELARR